MADSMSGKIIAITGAASGIGFATAKLLVERGAKVSIADNSPELDNAAQELARLAGSDDRVYAQSVDVRHNDQVESWLAATVKRFGRLDGAANIAGVFDYPGAALWHEERGVEHWDHVIGVNLTGTANCMRAELRHMTEPSARATHRAIVNMSSVAGIRARGGSPAYVASKHGVIGLTKSLAKEYGPTGVTINAIAPGHIDTPLSQKVGKELVDNLVAGLPVPRRGTAEETAKLVVYLLSEDASYITGATLTIDGGLTA